MPFQGSVDEANQFAIRGSVSSDTFPSLATYVDIVINRRLAATLPAQSGFSFDPSESLKPGTNLVEVFVSGSDQVLNNGTHQISGDLPAPTREASAEANEFLDRAGRLVAINSGHHILAVGSALSGALSARGIRVANNSRQFDLVLSLSLAESLYDVLKPGGKAAFYLPRGTDRPEAELRAIVLEAGFEILELEMTDATRALAVGRKPEVTN